jgi:hypothetical protein
MFSWLSTIVQAQLMHEQFIPLAEQQYTFHTSLAKDSTMHPVGINSANGEIVYVNHASDLWGMFPAACWQLFGLARDNMWREEATKRMLGSQMQLFANPTSNAILAYASAYEKTLDSTAKAHLLRLADQLIDSVNAVGKNHRQEMAFKLLLLADGLCKAYEINAKEQYLRILLQTADSLAASTSTLNPLTNADTLAALRNNGLLSMVYALLYTYSEQGALLKKSAQCISKIQQWSKPLTQRQFTGIPLHIEQLITSNSDKLTLTLLLNTWKLTTSAEGKTSKAQMTALESDLLNCLYNNNWISDLRGNAFFILNSKGMSDANTTLTQTHAAIYPDYFLLRFLSRPY